MCKNMTHQGFSNGPPYGVRTCNLQNRNLMLYPVGLRAVLLHITYLLYHTDLLFAIDFKKNYPVYILFFTFPHLQSVIFRYANEIIKMKTQRSLSLPISVFYNL